MFYFYAISCFTVFLNLLTLPNWLCHLDLIFWYLSKPTLIGPYNMGFFFLVLISYLISDLQVVKFSYFTFEHNPILYSQCYVIG